MLCNPLRPPATAGTVVVEVFFAMVMTIAMTMAMDSIRLLLVVFITETSTNATGSGRYLLIQQMVWLSAGLT